MRASIITSVRPTQWLPLIVAGAVACSSSTKQPEPDPTATPPGESTANTGATKQPPAAVTKRTLPPGVLDEAKGKQGVIRVEQKAGLRLLRIDDVIQGAMHTNARLVPRDPLVSLLKTVRPNAKRVLLIGLGTGATAMDLSRAGFAVDVVELEPKVIEFARKYFGYKGKATAADGAAFIKTNTTKHDIIIVDAFTDGHGPPRNLTSRQALRTMVKNGAANAVVAVRGVATPATSWVGQLMHTMRRADTMLYPALFGSGVTGAERQNLYALTSAKPLNFTNSKGLMLWPIQQTRYSNGGMRRVPGSKDHAFKPQRHVDLVGYVTKLADGSLALDLPHWEMGAIRFVLAGAKANALASLIPAGAKFPTAGDIRSDGPTRGTLYSVFGGGGGKRSEVRFSPVVAALSGTATLISVIHVNAALGVPRRYRQGATNDKRLPYGGSLYKLDIDNVHWSFTYEQWRELQRKAKPHIARAVQHINRGKLRRAVKETKGYLYAFDTRFKAHAKRILAYRALDERFTKLKKYAFQVGGRAKPFALAKACDHAASGHKIITTDKSATAATRLVRALNDCARANYERAMKADKPNRDTSIRRLLSLYDVMDFDVGKFKARVYKRKLQRLRKRFPGKQPLNEAP